MIQNLVNYAVYYAEKGFSVLPMHNKKPLIRFADKPPLKPDEIRVLWRKHPYANIALRTINFFVVDIDRHENGADGFESIKDKHFFRKTLAQKTAGNGQQLFYLKNEKQHIQQNIGWLPGVDIKAHPNNYVVVAPSRIGNRCYQWLNQEPIVTPSPELVKSINQHSNTFNVSNYSVTTQQTGTSKLFEQVIDGLGDTGGRNNALASFVGGLLFRDVDAQKTYELAKIANANTPDSLPQKEFDRTFESMLKKEIRRREEAKNGA